MSLLAVLALCGCGKRQGSGEFDLDAALRRADEAWDQRALVGFEPTESALQVAWAEEPKHPEVLWRLARLQLGQGLASAEPAERRDYFARARASADQCLQADPVFVEMRAERGLSAAVDLLDPRVEPCVAWAAFSWVRWVRVHGGAAAALDLSDIRTLSKFARANAGDAAELQAIVDWTDALWFSVAPRWEGGSMSRASDLYETVSLRRPRDPWPRVDFAELVLVPSQDLEGLIAVKEGDYRKRFPEDKQALERLASVQVLGPTPMGQ